MAVATEAVERLPALISKDEQLDILLGSAGCILSLLSLYAVHPSPCTLEVAIQCGDRLLAAAQSMPQGTAWTTFRDQPPLGGFSHGTAGIALSLLKLAASSGQERFRQGRHHPRDAAAARHVFRRPLAVARRNRRAASQGTRRVLHRELREDGDHRSTERVVQGKGLGSAEWFAQNASGQGGLTHATDALSHHLGGGGA